MDDATIRRHASAARRTILDILAEDGDLDREGLVDAWTQRRPPTGEAHRRRLPRMIGELLWRLEILGWVCVADDRYSLTPLGHRARG